MPSSIPASERALRAKKAAHTKWATHDPVEGTAAARAAFLDRFETEVDPEGVLPAEERQRRAEQARKAYFAGLALKSAQSRRKVAADIEPKVSALEARVAAIEDTIDGALVAGVTAIENNDAPEEADE